MNITDPIRRHAYIAPDAPALVRADGRTVNYRELDRLIDALALRAREFGLGPGSIATLNLATPYAFLVMALALARLGVTGVPNFMSSAKIDLCLTEAGLPAQSSARTVVLDTGWADPPATDAAVPSTASYGESQAICRIFPSSGTTGTPKFIAVSHDLLMRRIFARWLAMRLPDIPRMICALGAGTHYGFINLLRVLWVGGLVVMPGDRERFVSAIEQYQVNTLVIAPDTLSNLVADRRDAQGRLPSLAAIEVGGSHLSRRLYDSVVARLCPNIVSSYGSVEASAIAAATMSDLIDLPGAVGYVFPGVEVEVVDENDLSVAPGTDGIVRVRSDRCVQSYVDDPAASAGVFRDGWFYSGDLGSLTTDGLLFIKGRANEVINSGGTKVSPHIIETVLLSLEGISDAAAFGAPNELGTIQIWAAIVPDAPVDATHLLALCRERLKENAPTRLLQLERLPRNAHGKVLRDELRKLAAK